MTNFVSLTCQKVWRQPFPSKAALKMRFSQAESKVAGMSWSHEAMPQTTIRRLDMSRGAVYTVGRLICGASLLLVCISGGYLLIMVHLIILLWWFAYFELLCLWICNHGNTYQTTKWRSKLGLVKYVWKKKTCKICFCSDSEWLIPIVMGVSHGCKFFSWIPTSQDKSVMLDWDVAIAPWQSYC